MITFLFYIFISFCLTTIDGFYIISPTQYRLNHVQLNMAKRIPLIAGNWKCNTELSSAIILIKELLELNKKVNPKNTEIVVVPPFPFLYEVFKVIQGSKQKLSLGAQTVYFEKKGAFTGAISSSMLKSIGCSYVLVGHSERRKVFGETDLDFNKEVKSVLESNMSPILCIGETKDEYKQGLTLSTCRLQLAKALKDVPANDISKIVIAYEPVWAIGTGLTATPEIAQSVHSDIRLWLKQRFGKDIAESVRILYGGSVTADSVDDLMTCPDIDGALVGGASLSASSFSRIIQFRKPSAFSRLVSFGRTVFSFIKKFFGSIFNIF